MTPKEYSKLVKSLEPKSPLLKDCIFAFLIGGAICAIGQLVMNGYTALGLNKTDSGTATSMTMVALSALLTGFSLYDNIAKYAGAGTLVPITGFANGVCASAIEFKKEGQVFGIGCQIFRIAGPVILYGIFSSWVLGFIYWILKML